MIHTPRLTADVLDGLGEVGTGPLFIGPSLPHLQHLEMDVRCGRAAGAGGLAGLSRDLKSLELHGIIDLGELEVKVCAVSLSVLWIMNSPNVKKNSRRAELCVQSV